jgi:hypothetical protein
MKSDGNSLVAARVRLALPDLSRNAVSMQMHSYFITYQPERI